MSMTYEQEVADLKKKIGAELATIPSCVRAGGVMLAHEYKRRADEATKLTAKQRPKLDELKNALYLLQTIEKYQPPHVPMSAEGRMR